MDSTQFGLALIHLAAESKNVNIRRSAVALLQSMTVRYPTITNWMIRDALLHRLSREEASQKADSGDEEKDRPARLLQGRLHAILAASASLPEDIDLDSREVEMLQNLILAHHPAICTAFFFFFWLLPISD